MSALGVGEDVASKDMSTFCLCSMVRDGTDLRLCGEVGVGSRSARVAGAFGLDALAGGRRSRARGFRNTQQYQP